MSHHSQILSQVEPQTDSLVEIRQMFLWPQPPPANPVGSTSSGSPSNHGPASSGAVQLCQRKNRAALSY